MDIQTPPSCLAKLFDDIQNEHKGAPAIEANLNTVVNQEPLAYFVTLEQADGTSQVVQLSEEEIKALGLFSNGASENGTTNLVQAIENGTVNYVEANDNTTLNHVDITNTDSVIQVVKHPIQSVKSRKRGISGEDLSSSDRTKKKLSYSSTILQTDGTSRVVELTEEEVKALGVFSNGTSENTITNFINTSENGRVNYAEASSNTTVNYVEATSVNPIRPTKQTNRVIKRRKKVVSGADVYSGNNLEKKLTTNLLCYPSTLLQADGSQVVELTEMEVKDLEVFSNSANENCPINLTESTKNDSVNFTEANDSSTSNHIDTINSNLMENPKDTVRLQENDINVIKNTIAEIYSEDTANKKLAANLFSYSSTMLQASGNSQVVQLINDEVRALKVLSNDTTNGTTNLVKANKNVLPLCVEATNINNVIQPEMNLKKLVKPRKKISSCRKKTVIQVYDKSKEKPITNLISYSSTLLQPHVVELTEEDARTLGIFSNENGTSNTVLTTSAETVDNGAANHDVINNYSTIQMKHLNKTILHHNKIVNGGRNAKEQPTSNLVSYSSTMLEADRASEVVLTEEQARALGILPNDMLKKNITNPIEATDSYIANRDEVSNTNALMQPIKCSTKTVIPHKKITYVKNNSGTVVYSDTNSNGKTNIDLMSYSSPVLQADDTSQVEQQNEGEEIVLTEEQARALGILPNDTSENGTTNLTKTAKCVTSNHVETIHSKSNHIEASNNQTAVQPVKSNRAVPLCKKVTTNTKNTVIKISEDKNLKEKPADLVKPLGSCDNPIEIIKDGEVLHSTQNLSQDYLQQIAEALQSEPAKTNEEVKTVNKEPPSIIYRVVYPEELDLKPKTAKLKRGRPKRKAPSEEPPEEEVVVQSVKTVRTRSGRITKPPKFKDFKNIDNCEEIGVETEFKIIEQEAVAVNEPPTVENAPVDLSGLEFHQRKRSIAAQFRCPKCKKAYLGRVKMLKHLQMHPDHGPIPKHLKAKHSETWNFLIEISNKSPVGQRGLKFCKELGNFLENLRSLAKMFFKRPVGVEKNLYFVDSTLSSVLGIESGNYILNEIELFKEGDVFSAINKFFNDFNKQTKEDTDTIAKTQTESFNLDAFVEKCQTDLQSTENISHQNVTLVENENCDMINNKDDFNEKLNADESKKSDCKLPNIDFGQDKLNFDTVPHCEQNGFNLNCNINSESTLNPEHHKFHKTIANENNFNGENCKRKSPQLDINNTSQINEHNDDIKAINPDLSLHSELLSDNSLLNSLPNLRSSVEELMLNNVDSTHVNNLLDNSTSSDEIMNVDQFVNERFKNLTESDLEPPNTSIHLDLPSLDLFQFHTS